MVRGLERFRDHFAGYSENYVIIGGTACSLSMDEAGLDFRVTKDLDIVLCVEALSAEFGRAFWNFIHEGGYKNQQKSTDRKLFYRFYDPEDDSYPYMLELFSRLPDVLRSTGESHLTPIPMEEEVSSLSAILLDPDYYQLIHSSKEESNGVKICSPECLVPLKAKAWLDMKQRQEQGRHVDERSIRKHRNDIFRIFQIVRQDRIPSIPNSIRKDLEEFISVVRSEDSIDLKALGLRRIGLEELLNELEKLYGLN